MRRTTIEPTNRIPRHEHRVRTFSRDYELIIGVGDRYVVEAAEVRDLVGHASATFGIPEPDLVFNSRRRSDTGQCWAPRSLAVQTYGEDRVAAWERHHRRSYPAGGQIRLGTMTTVRTLSHEFGHHLVHMLEPTRTPAHGKVWVARFDDAIECIASHLGVSATS
jgi:hypothetical protein